MEPKNNGSASDATTSIPEEEPIKSDAKKINCIFDTKDRYYIISFSLSIILIVCMVLPWMIWTGGEHSITYNALDMLSFKWEGASSFSRFIPMVSSICGIVSLIGLLLRSRRTCTVCLSFAASLLSVILILVFYVMTYLYTGLACYYGFYFAFLVSLALTLFNLNVAEGLKSWKKKKPTKNKQKRTIELRHLHGISSLKNTKKINERAGRKLDGWESRSFFEERTSGDATVLLYGKSTNEYLIQIYGGHRI